MHITIDAHLAVKEIDGIARYLIGLLEELPKLDRSIQYTIFDLPRNQSGLPEEIFQNKNVKRLEFNLYGPSPKQHLVTPRILRTLNADIYHHPQYDLPFGINIPSVATIHDLKFIYHPEFLTRKSWLKSFNIKSALKYTLKKADKIIAVSENTLTLQRHLLIILQYIAVLLYLTILHIVTNDLNVVVGLKDINSFCPDSSS